MAQPKIPFKVMIVDDHSDMRKMLRSVVETKLGPSTEFIECDNGEEAVLLYDEEHPNYVLMDVQLKRMNGFEATERIFDHDPNARVIFVSSHNTSAFRLKALTLKADGFVSKDNLSELDLFLHKR